MKRAIPLLAVVALALGLVPAAAPEPTAPGEPQAYALKGRFVTFTPVVPFQRDEDAYPIDMRLPSFSRSPTDSTEDGYQIIPILEGLDGSAADEEFLSQLGSLDPSFNYSIAASLEAKAAPGRAIGLGGGAVNQPLLVGGTTNYFFFISLGVPQPHKTGMVIVQHQQFRVEGDSPIVGSGPPVAVVPGGTYTRMMGGGWMSRKDDEEGRLRVEKWSPGSMLLLTLLPADADTADRESSHVPSPAASLGVGDSIPAG